MAKSEAELRALGDIEIEGSLGELDYNGIVLNSMDKMVEFIAESIVAPEVQRRINTITGETERSIKVRREGFFDPRFSATSKLQTIGPRWSVFSDPDDIEHAIILEFGHGGENAFMRPAARARRVKTAIRIVLQTRFPKFMRVSVRSARRFKKKTKQTTRRPRPR